MAKSINDNSELTNKNQRYEEILQKLTTLKRSAYEYVSQAMNQLKNWNFEHLYKNLLSSIKFVLTYSSNIDEVNSVFEIIKQLDQEIFELDDDPYSLLLHNSHLTIQLRR